MEYWCKQSQMLQWKWIMANTAIKNVPVGELGHSVLARSFISEHDHRDCCLNKDLEIDDTCQLTPPDIQLKHADRVFRLYVKSLHDKAVYRSEESFTLKRILPKALESIRYPYKSVEKLDELPERIKQIIDISQFNMMVPIIIIIIIMTPVPAGVCSQGQHS
jgi:hypothetical protein